MVSCLTRLSSGEWTRDAKTLETAYRIVRSMLLEILLVGRSMGYDESLLPSAVVDSIIDKERDRTCASPEADTFVTSALLDIRNGQPFELEVILGAVIRMGRERMVTIPTLELVYGALSIVQTDLLRGGRTNR